MQISLEVEKLTRYCISVLKEGLIKYGIKENWNISMNNIIKENKDYLEKLV